MIMTKMKYKITKKCCVLVEFFLIPLKPPPKNSM